MRRANVCLLAAVTVAGLAAQNASRSAEWPSYAGDPQGRRYSPLTQIDRTNVSRLTLAWRYGVAAGGATPNAVGRSQAVPILVGGKLYTSTAQRTIAALDPATGQEIWKHAVDKGGAPTRGVSYWAGGGGSTPRILAGTTGGRPDAPDARTGTLV